MQESDKIVDATIEDETIRELIKAHANEFLEKVYPNVTDELTKESLRVSFLTGFCDCFKNIVLKHYDINELW